MELDLELEMELDTLELIELDRELDELDRELERELETELDEINMVLDELKTILNELDLELDKLEDREDETELIADDKNELLREELLITAELEIAVLLELVTAIVDEDSARDELFEGSSITGASAPQAVNKQSREIQNRTLIFTLFY